MVMTTVGFVRHGITEWNVEGRAQGQTDIPLNEDGRKQAAALADRLLSKEGWDVIASSDLKRARETAEIIARRLHIGEIVFDERLREIHCGLIEGLTVEERVAKWGEDWRGQALEMDKSEQYWKMREQVVRALGALHGAEDVGTAALPLSESRDQAGMILDILELCARDIMAAQDADGDVIQTDLHLVLPTDRFSGAQMLKSVMEARKRLASNVSWQSVLEMLFFDMAGGNRLWQQ